VRLLAHLAGIAESILLRGSSPFLRSGFATLCGCQQRRHIHIAIGPHRVVDRHVVGAQAVDADGHNVVQAGLLELDQFHQRPQFAGAQHHADASAWLADRHSTRDARCVESHHRGQRVGCVQQVRIGY
jgi:hypothetical protein